MNQGGFSVAVAALTEAIRLEKEGRYAEAWSRCQSILKINPRHPDALHLCGVIAMREGRLGDAASLLTRTVKIMPKLFEAQLNLAHVYTLQGKWRERAEALKAALALQPDRGDIQSDIGKCYENLGRWAEAIGWYEKALATGMEPALTHVHLGIARQRLNLLAEAEAEFSAALAIDPSHDLALANLALARDERGDMDSVLPLLDRALAAHPDNVDVHYHRALALLTRGRLAEGWAEHVWRFRRSTATTPHALFPYPYWQGESLDGRCILVWTEQGPGDEIMAGTMLPEILARAAYGIVLCTPRLVPLFRRAFPTATVAAFADAVDAIAAAPPPDFQASLSHLGQQLRPSFERFPKIAAYLKADPARTESLRARYAARAAGKRLVGIAWRSANVNASAEKSTALRDWEPLLRSPGIQFVSLQYGDVRTEIKRINGDLGVDILHDPQIDPLTDMDAFAAQVAAVDEIVSVSNTTVHVAGALGKPVSILVPASYGRIWYWFLDRVDSPWYPTARLYRQVRERPWGDVLAAAAADLRARVQSPP